MDISPARKPLAARVIALIQKASGLLDKTIIGIASIAIIISIVAFVETPLQRRSLSTKEDVILGGITILFLVAVAAIESVKSPRLKPLADAVIGVIKIIVYSILIIAMGLIAITDLSNIL